jgi:hypothetical protein
MAPGAVASAGGGTEAAITGASGGAGHRARHTLRG